MFGKRIILFRLLGVAVYVDLSWLVIAALVVWSLAQGLFPSYYKGATVLAYWLMGVAGALGLFASIIVHEFCHALVARRQGMPIKGITLFLFGGVAEMHGEPQNPKDEFRMAIAGPAASTALSLGLFLLTIFAEARNWADEVRGVVSYLAWINLVLVVFNMVPAFPLDGGRVLRAILWHVKGDLRKATRIASQGGAFLGILLLGLGILAVLQGNVISGVWWVLIGMFIRQAAQASYQQVLIREALAGEPVRRFMVADPIAVPADTPVSEFVDQFVYRHHFKSYPVLKDGHLAGVVRLEDVKKLPRDQWDRHRVAELVHVCSPDNTVTPDADAMDALAAMNRAQTTRLLVVEGDRLVGILSLRDLLQFFALKMELEA